MEKKCFPSKHVHIALDTFRTTNKSLKLAQSNHQEAAFSSQTAIHPDILLVDIRRTPKHNGVNWVMAGHRCSRNPAKAAATRENHRAAIPEVTNESRTPKSFLYSTKNRVSDFPPTPKCKEPRRRTAQQQRAIEQSSNPRSPPSHTIVSLRLLGELGQAHHLLPLLHPLRFPAMDLSAAASPLLPLFTFLKWKVCEVYFPSPTVSFLKWDFFFLSTPCAHGMMDGCAPYICGGSWVSSSDFDFDVI